MRVHTLLVLVALAAVLLGYAGSYYRLSRRGMREAPEYGLEGFLYVPIEPMASGDDAVWRAAYAKHLALMWFFMPANWLDHQVLGNPEAVECLMRVSG
jgi:hypothetical protein